MVDHATSQSIISEDKESRESGLGSRHQTLMVGHTGQTVEARGPVWKLLKLFT